MILLLIFLALVLVILLATNRVSTTNALIGLIVLAVAYLLYAFV